MLPFRASGSVYMYGLYSVSQDRLSMSMNYDIYMPSDFTQSSLTRLDYKL